MILNGLTAMAYAASEAAGAAPGAGDNTVLSMMLHAGPMVKAIMAGLLGLSVVCWSIIVAKAILIRKANRESAAFIDRFGDRAGLGDSGGITTVLLENVERAIQGGIVRHRKRLQRFLPFLATTGSTASFIGLFGTV